MRKMLITAVLLLGLLGLGPEPASAQTAYAPTPPPGTGARAGEVALGSIVAPVRSSRGPATGLKANPSCAVQCITGGVAYGRGPDARLVVTTDTPATIRIVVSRSGYYRMISSAAGQTSFSADFGDLNADTHYDAFVSAVDANGDIANRQGSFRTLQRNVHVVYNEADVWTTPYGDDALYAQSWFEGQAGTPYATDDLEDGEVHLGARSHHEDDTDRYLSLGLELTQADEGADLCEAESDPDEPETGYGNCDYSATAWLADGELDLDAVPAGATNVNDYWISGTMLLPGGPALPHGYGSPLQFSVPLAVRVTFTP